MLFEQLNPHIRINRNVSINPSDMFLEPVIAALMAGDHPDVLLDYEQVFSSLSTPGMFKDFYEIMDSDPIFNIEDYYTNIFKAYEIDGRLYSFPVTFSYSLVTINRSMPDDIIEQYKQMKSISYLDMIRLYNESKTNLHIEDWFYNDVRMFLTREMARFIDFESSENNIDSEEFINILKEYKSVFKLGFDNNKGVTMMGRVFAPFPFHFMDNNDPHRVDLANAFFIPHTHQWFQLYFDFEKDPFVHLLPLVCSDGKLEPKYFSAWGGHSFMIPAGAEYPEEVWELVRFLASDIRTVEGIQAERAISSEANIPINRNIFKIVFMVKANGLMDDIANPGKEDVHATNLGDTSIILQNREKLIQEAYEQMENWNSMPMIPRHFDNLLEMTFNTLTDFLEGRITAETAARDLQNMMWLKLNE